VLSHGHYDHFGGLVGFLQKHKSRLKPKLPLYLGGEDCFCSRQWTGPPVRGAFGALDRQALKKANLSVTYAEGPSRARVSCSPDHVSPPSGDCLLWRASAPASGATILVRDSTSTLDVVEMLVTNFTAPVRLVALANSGRRPTGL
jgi:ribonuclease BN (tRNA processing enzyme)